jgi:hypothetical protein
MRSKTVVPLVLVAGLALASLGLWAWAVARVQAGFAAWRREAAAAGWTVRSGTMHRAGWPLAAELVLTDATLAAGPDLLPGGAGWTAQRAVLHVAPWAPGTLLVRLEGAQQVRAFGSAAATLLAARLTLTVNLGDPAAPVRLDGSDLRFAPPLGGMSIGLLAAELPQGAGPPRATLSAEAIALPPGWPLALGNRIASATVTLALEGALPPPSPDAAGRAAAWQRAGGLLRVRHMALGWGPLGVTGTAALGLDPALQPDGTGTLRVVGFEPALSALAAGGVVRPSAAQAVRAVLTLLARTPEGGGTPEVTLPLTLHGGTLEVGGFPVARVPHWDWSAAP